MLLEQNRIEVARKEDRRAKRKRTHDRRNARDEAEVREALADAVHDERHHDADKDGAAPEERGLRARNECFRARSGTRRSRESRLHERKEHERFGNVRDVGGGREAVRRTDVELLAAFEHFNETEGAGKARKEPENRKRRGVPERNARRLREKKARVRGRGDAKNGIEPSDDVALKERFVLVPGFLLLCGDDEERLDHRHDAEDRKDADADEHPAAEVETPFHKGVDRRKREVEEPRQVRNHEKRPRDTGDRREKEHLLRAQPEVEREAHAGEPHEPEEERDRPAPVARRNLLGEIEHVSRHFDTTTKKLGFVPF